MKSKALFLIFLISFLLPILSVKAQPQAYTLDLTCDRDYYYLKGDTIHLFATSNVSGIDVTLSVYRKGTNLIYQNTKQTNATWNIPTTNAIPDHYKFVAMTTEQTITIWRTLLNTEDYVPATLPFSYVWNGVKYTLEGRRLRAETKDDYIEITYPKIPFQHRTRFYRNNMTFVIRLDNATQGWAVDVTYATCYCGLKWIINGTLDNPKTFDIQCQQNPLKQWKKQLDRITSNSYLTFDWSDIRKAQQAFSWDAITNTLHVEVPSSFSIDPTIFEDGFESEDPYSPWTATTTSGGSTITATSSMQHCGTNSSNSTIATTYDWAACYKDLGSDYDTLYLRAYVNVPTISNTKYYCTPIGLYDNDNYKWLIRTYIKNDAGTYKWGIRWEDSGCQALVLSTQHTATPGNWYCVEIYATVGDGTGAVKTYVEDSELTDISQSSLTNNYPMDRVYGGHIADNTDDGASIYVDCFVVDDEYIGPEEEGEIHNIYGDITNQTTAIHEKSMSFIRESDLGQVFTIDSERSWQSTIYSTVSQIWSVLSTRMWSLSRFSTVTLQFTVDHTVEALRLILIYGDIPHLLTIGTSKTASFTIQSLITQLITIASTLEMPGLLNVYATIGLRFLVQQWNDLTEAVTYATQGFVIVLFFLVILCFGLILPIGFTLLRKK